MTNSRDFRRYSYSTDTAYALKAFEQGRATYSGSAVAAPEYMPRQKRELKLHENPKAKSHKQLVREEKEAMIKALQIAVISLVSLVLLFSVLFMNAKKNELSHEITSIESDISVSQSEYTRLNAQIDSILSVSMIDQYAVEKLGMSKMQSNKIHYIDVNEYKETRQKTSQKQSPASSAQDLQ